jgi:hypothetical protein
MPGYSEKAQPYLDAIADAVFSSQEVRDWLIAGTPSEALFSGATVLYDEQRDVRWYRRPTRQPFWANYWCGRDGLCECRPSGSRGLESDAIFFLRNSSTRVLAVHIEFKHPKEKFGVGQPEAYPLRAACFARTHESRRTVCAHDDWATVIFCGEDTNLDLRISNFQRVIHHSDAEAMIPNYPTPQLKNK